MDGALARQLGLAAVLAFLVGCREGDSQSQSEPSPSPSFAVKFDPANTGTIRGRVVWQGEIPSVPPFEVYANLPQNHPGQARLIRANPNAPVVHKTSRGVHGAVVFLRGIDPEKSRPWDHTPVRIEQHDRRLHVVQGARDGNVGFVRVGDEIEMVSRDARFHALRATGDAFFALTFPDPDQPLKRRLTKKGLVELSSAAGYYWMRGYLFVAEHPYFALTDSQGSFVLSQVPARNYELVCWLPNWRPARRDRDPESSLVSRLYFHAPVEQRQEVSVTAHQEVSCESAVSAALFER